MPANLVSAAVATGLEKLSFHSNPKERQCQRMLKLPHNCTHLSKVMLKILQARLQQYVNREISEVFKLVLEKAEEPEIKLSMYVGLSKKQESSRKTSISALLTMLKSLCQSQQTVENSSTDGNTRPLDQALEKSTCRTGSNS